MATTTKNNDKRNGVEVFEISREAFEQMAMSEDGRLCTRLVLDKLPEHDCYVVAKSWSWFGEQPVVVFVNSRHVYSTEAMAVSEAVRYSDMFLCDMRDGYTTCGVDFEIWHIVEDSDDSEEERESFSSIVDVLDYVVAAIGDEYTDDYDLHAICDSVATYDADRGCFVLCVDEDGFWRAVASAETPNECACCVCRDCCEVCNELNDAEAHEAQPSYPFLMASDGSMMLSALRGLYDVDLLTSLLFDDSGMRDSHGRHFVTWADASPEYIATVLRLCYEG